MGIGEAAEYLKFPVVSGNVSFYNQTKEEGIKPTPSIGGVGLIKDHNKMITIDFKEVDNIVLVIGKTEGHIDQSLFARNILDEKNGPPPEKEKKPIMLENLRNIFYRMELSDKETRILSSVFASLGKKR